MAIRRSGKPASGKASGKASAGAGTSSKAGPGSKRGGRSEADAPPSRPRRSRPSGSKPRGARGSKPGSSDSPGGGASKPGESSPASSSTRRRNQRVSRPSKSASQPEVPNVPLTDRASAGIRTVGQRLAPLRRPALIGLRALGLLVAVAGAAAVGSLVQEHLRTSKSFATETVDVEGGERMEREEILDVAGLSVGQNVFEVSPEAAQARLLAHPWIADATVSRRLPGHFSVHVREQRAVALLVVETCADDVLRDEQSECAKHPVSTLYLVSEEGSVFKRLDGEDPVDLPVITGVPRQRFGTDLSFRSSVLLEAVALLHEYRAAGLWRRMPIAEIHLEADDGFSLYAGGDLTHIRLGKPPFQSKLRRMRKVLDRLDREEASAAYVYLDNHRRPDRVTVRLR